MAGSAVDFSQEGRVAIVTGAGRNIGRAIALELAHQGARIVVNGRSNAEAAEETVRQVKAMGVDATFHLADIGDPVQAEALVQHAVKTFGSADIVVCNAAIRPHQPMLEISVEDWDHVLRNNLSSAFFINRIAIPHMIKRKWGRIIHISGSDGYKGHVNRAHNVVCKSGVHALAKAIGQEFGPHGITANVVAPGWVDTERDWTQYPHLKYEEEVKRIPVRRIGSVSDIAAACVYLASDSAGYITGQVIHANGGMYMGLA